MDFGTVTRNVQWFEEMMLVLVIQSEGFLLNLRQMGIQGMPNLRIIKNYIINVKKYSTENTNIIEFFFRNFLPGIGLLFDNAIGEDAVGAPDGPVDGGGGVDFGDGDGLGLLVLLAAVVTVEVVVSAPPDVDDTTRLKGSAP